MKKHKTKLDAALETLRNPGGGMTLVGHGFVPGALTPATGWQPLSTAPKDGTEIVLVGYLSHDDGRSLRACVSRWPTRETDTPCYVMDAWCYSAPGFSDTFEPIGWIPAPSQEQRAEP